MSPPLTPAHQSAVVTKLRSAGCVYAEDEAALLVAAAATADDLSAMVDRRVTGHPLEHVLGWVEFAGLRIAVDDGVFVPRRRTELMVRRASGHARSGAVVVDLCCGSGAVGVALATIVKVGEIHAVDIDAAAVACAGRNLAPFAGAVYEGDLFGPLPPRLRGRVDVLVANAPYVPSGSIELLPPEARLHEARVALDGGPGGLDVLRRVIRGAAAWLAPHGRVLVESSAGQARALVDEAHLVRPGR